MGNLPFLLLLFTYFLQISSSIESLQYVYGKCLNDQRLNLLQFREGLQFNSAYSNKLVHWNQSRDCCSWNGVSCDGFGRVISLELEDEGISVRNEVAWKSIFNLQHLERLNLAWNNFNLVKIPTELHNLTKLKYLNLSEAGFVGQIPIGLSRMKNLVTLDLSNRFSYQPIETKNIPGGLRALFYNLTELRELYLDGVNISAQGSDWCTAFSTLSKLQVLSLSGCYLSGPLDSSLLQLSSLTTLRLDGNNLSTVDPNFFSNFTNLTTLSLVSCYLKGKFPEKIFQVPTLQRILFSGNLFLGGSLPEFPHNNSFREIVLSNTNFSGPLPDSIGNLRALSWIEFSNCSFSGPIPAKLSNLKILVYIDLSYNKFNGSVPSFQMFKKLVHIDLSHNSFTGPIPSAHYEDLIDLEDINFGHNSLGGNIPLSLFTLPSLKKLQLSNNQFDGQLNEIPNARSSLLDVLDLSSNYLRGPMPKYFFELERLVVLYLSFNFFSGTLRLEMFEGLHNLSELDLSYNKLSIDASCSTLTSFSSLPQFIVLKLASCNLRMFPDLKNQSEMFHLDLSQNHIAGEIPNWIWKSMHLVHLNLSFNFLTDVQKPYTMPFSLLLLDLHANQLGGEIPTPPLGILYLDYSSNNFSISIPLNIGDYLSVTSFLSFSNNNIAGCIPKSMCNASYLQVLDLSKNALSGQIPDCLLQMIENITVLNLGDNNLQGMVPDTFREKCELRTLDISRNFLKGKIPRSLANCKALQVLNVGKNMIEDTFPCRLMKESHLQVLVLRSNRFQGGIGCPKYNHSWSSLQIMDIAHNNFSGVLSPRQFLNLRRMIEDNEAATSSEYLQFGFFQLSNLYYKDAVTLTINGLELELVKILKTYKTIDFSGNKFHGRIPDTVGELTLLYILNLSNNGFTGTIPESIGNLTQLGSLDLSKNLLTGRIPGKLAGLTFLSFLNLSFNDLFGEIPIGPQFQTFTDLSYLGNRGLCGFPLNISCNNSKAKKLSPISPLFESKRDSAKNEIEWEYVSAALGFGVGLGIISWLNFSCPLWWQKFNAFVLQFLLRIFHQQTKVLRNPIRKL